MSESKHTPGPWFVGAQNDALYIIDRRPAHSNDYPDHEADVGCIAKVYDDIRDAEIGQANAALIARAPDLAAEVERLRAENVELRQWEETHISVHRRDTQALAELRRKVEALREMVQESAALFRRYEKLHHKRSRAGAAVADQRLTRGETVQGRVIPRQRRDSRLQRRAGARRQGQP